MTGRGVFALALAASAALHAALLLRVPVAGSGPSGPAPSEVAIGTRSFASLSAATVAPTAPASREQTVPAPPPPAQAATPERPAARQPNALAPSPGANATAPAATAEPPVAPTTVDRTATAQDPLALASPPERPRLRPDGPEAAGPSRSDAVAPPKPTRAPSASGGGSLSSTPAPAATESEIAAYKSRVIRQIQRLPVRSVGARGVARVRVEIAGSGRIASIALTAASGSSRVDRSALSVVRRAGPFPPPPGRQPVRLFVNVESRG